MDYRERITIELGKRSGKPCIRGLRISAADVIDYLACGMSESRLFKTFRSFPSRISEPVWPSRLIEGEGLPRPVPGEAVLRPEPLLQARDSSLASVPGLDARRRRRPIPDVRRGDLELRRISRVPDRFVGRRFPATVDAPRCVPTVMWFQVRNGTTPQIEQLLRRRYPATESHSRGAESTFLIVRMATL